MIVLYQTLRKPENENEDLIFESEKEIEIETPKELIQKLQAFVKRHPKAEFDGYSGGLCLVSCDGDRTYYMEVMN